MRGRVNWLLAGFAAAFLCSCAGTAISQTLRPLPWPTELPRELLPKASLYVSEKSNLLLDLHGSIQNPDLVIFMAGNQYRVLPELVSTFREWLRGQSGHGGLRVDQIFYATMPPGRLIDAMQGGQLVLGNFWLDVRPDKLWPDVFMTGARQQRRLRAAKYVEKWSVYTRNRGTVLLVRAGNPKNIRGLADLLRDDVRVAISSPVREPASFESYANTLRAQGGSGFPDLVLRKPSTISPTVVHHRENPQFIYDGAADVAPMYYHFGDYLKTHMPEYFDYVPLPAEGNYRDELAVSLIRNAPHKAAAAAWIDFMRSDAAASVYNRNGFEYASAEERVRMVEQ